MLDDAIGEEGASQSNMSDIQVNAQRAASRFTNVFLNMAKVPIFSWVISISISIRVVKLLNARKSKLNEFGMMFESPSFSPFPVKVRLVS